jgi:hypothetical protein
MIEKPYEPKTREVLAKETAAKILESDIEDAQKSEKKHFRNALVWSITAIITTVCTFVLSDYEPSWLPNSFWIGMKEFWSGWIGFAIFFNIIWLWSKIRTKRLLKKA